MNLRDLEYFVAVAELGQFGQAAERCHVSQPTLSGQLRKLEDELGQPLFERDTRNVRLSAFGKEALVLARAVGAKAREIETLAKKMADPFRGPVALGAFPTLAPWLLPQLAPHFAHCCPQAEFFLSEEKSPVLLAQLLAGELDAAFLALPVASAELEALPLFAEAFLVAVPVGHPWAEREALEPRELEGAELILLADGHCLRDQALDLCQRYGARERGQFRATSLETLRQMVRLGSGITLMPRLAVPAEAESGIRYLPVRGDDVRREIGLAFRPTHPRRRFFQHVAQMVRELCGERLPVRAL